MNKLFFLIAIAAMLGGVSAELAIDKISGNPVGLAIDKITGQPAVGSREVYQALEIAADVADPCQLPDDMAVYAPDLKITLGQNGGQSPYTVTALIRNIGPAPAAPSWAAFVYDGWPTPIRWASIPSLNHGESYTVQFDDVACTVPPENIMAYADFGNTVAEALECNNYAEMGIPTCQPDYISSMAQTTPAEPQDGLVAFSVTTHNQGDGSGGISTTTVTDEGDNEIDAMNVAPLSPAQDYVFYTQHTCEPDTNATYYSHADAHNVLSEHSDGNNDNSLTVWCPGTPDYIVSIVNVNNYTSAGQISFYVNTSNVGTAHTTDSSTTQVLIDGGAIELNVPALAKNGEDMQYVAISCEPGTTVALGANADYYDQISEITNSNNAAEEVLVGCPGPDYVASIGTPDTHVGGELLFSVTTSNIGAVGTGSSSSTHIEFDGLGATYDFNVDPLGAGASYIYDLGAIGCEPGSEITIYATADNEGDVEETNELNNDATPVPVTCSGADYTVSFGEPDTSVDRQITFQVTTHNIGDGAATVPSVTSVTSPDNADQYLNVIALGADGSSVTDATINCTPGTHVSYTAYADSGHVITELSEGNNDATVEDVLCPGKPDYVVSLGEPDTSVESHVTFYVTTTNEGDVPATAGSVTNVTVDGNFVQALNVPALDVGQSAPADSVTVACVPGTTIALGAYADAEDAILESNEGNNEATPRNVLCPGPDYISGIDAIDNETGDGLVSFNVTTYNDGDVAALSSSFTRASAPDNADQMLPVDPLAAGASATSRVTVNCTPLTYINLTSYADAEYAVAETNEGNNDAHAYEVLCPGKPDYVVSISDASSEPVDAKFFLNVTTTNIGTEGAGANSYTNISLNDYKFNAISVNPLGVGESYSEIKAVDCSPGLYFLVGAYADGNLEITETYEENNNATIEGMMLCPGKPDYVPTFEIADESPGNLTLRVITTNIDEVAWMNSITNVTDGAGSVLASETILPLGAGGNQSFEVRIGCVPGYNVSVHAIADSGNALDESNEMNNVAVFNRACPGYFDVELSEGWNLISFPLTPTNNSSAWVFGSNPDIAIVWYYNNGSWYNYVPGVGGTLQQTTRGKAYMVNATAPTTLRVYGLQERSQPDPPGWPIPPFQIDVFAGWNMLGIYAPANGTMNYVTGTMPGQYYDADYNPVDPATTNVPLGDGFWMYTNSADFYFPRT